MTDSTYKIYLDMDGVLTDWEKQFKVYSGGVDVDTYKAKYGENSRYQFVRKNSPDFYGTMDWMKDGRVLYNFLSELGTPVEILSHATDNEAKLGKLRWLKNHGVNITPNLVDKSENKARFATANSILIDDKPRNVNEFIAAGGKAILHKSAIDTINKLKEITGVKKSHRIYNSVLNPEFWDSHNVLKPDIQEHLLTVGRTFFKETELTVPIIDIVFIGSSAGYNWTPTSDMDVHIIVDFKLIGENKELVKKYVDALKNKWNESHHIHIGNHPVEVYIQDKNESNKSNAVYSLLKNEWIKKPTYIKLQIDKQAIRDKYNRYVNSIDNAIKSNNIKQLRYIILRLYEMRQNGLDKAGEFSTENLVFKLLRNDGYIGRIRNEIKNIQDKSLSKR